MKESREQAEKNTHSAESDETTRRDPMKESREQAEKNTHGSETEKRGFFLSTRSPTVQVKMSGRPLIKRGTGV
jgi:hypothetical protein